MEKLPPTILVIEDECAARQSLVEVLEQEGFNCLEASEVEIALEVIFNASKIDLILSDLKLNNEDEGGFQVLQQLKEKPQTKNIPVIFLTGYTGKDLIIKAMKAGAADYLTKPYTDAELLGAIAAQLGTVKRKPSKGQKTKYYIVLFSPTHQGEEITLRPNHTIGRSSNATTTVRDPHVSRISITLQRMTHSNPIYTEAVDGQITGQSQPIKSANGIFVNGHRIIDTCPLKNGDRVDLSANTWFEYRAELLAAGEEEDERPTAF